MNKSFKKAVAAISVTAMLTASYAMPVYAATQVKVTGNPVMIRSNAGLKNTVVSKAHKGDTFAYVGEKKDTSGKVWYNIKYSGDKTGWIISTFSKKTEDTAVNPVKDYEGTYQCDRAVLTVKATGKNDADITVEWASSAFENTVWTFSSSFDTSTYRINYSDGVKTNYIYDENGNVKSKKVVYNDGMGRVQFHKDKQTLVWRDEKEQQNGEMTFTKVSTPDYDKAQTITGKQVEITASPVNVRANAGTNYKKIGTTSKGKKYNCLASKKDAKGVVWYQIQYTSKTKGWVTSKLSKLVSKSEETVISGKQVEITGSPVNVRANAGTNYKKIGSTSKGKKYACLASKKDAKGVVWYQIQYTSKTKGWVTSTYSKLVDKEETPVNPATIYEGTYQNGPATLTIRISDDNKAEITIELASSPTEVTKWVMSDVFVSDNLRINYTNAVRTDYVYDELGNLISQTVAYKDGFGRIQFYDFKSLAWQDERENADGQIIFTKIK